MRVLVTGGGGYVGNVLCRQLLDKGYSVRCMDNFHKGQCDALLGIIDNSQFQFFYGDVTKANDCIKACLDIDVVVHLAGIVGFPACASQPALSEAVNIQGTANMCDAYKQIMPRGKFINASTGSVYGQIEDICTEDSPRNPQSDYGRQKYQAECMVNHLSKGVSLRFATGFGVSPCMRVNLLVNDLVYQAIHNRCFTVFQADFRRTFIHVQDMGRAIIHCIENDMIHKVYNCGDTNLNWTKRELAEYIKSRTGCVVNYEDFAKDLDKRDYEVDYRRLANERFHCVWTMEKGIEGLIKATKLLKINHNYI